MPSDNRDPRREPNFDSHPSESNVFLMSRSTDGSDRTGAIEGLAGRFAGSKQLYVVASGSCGADI